MLQHTSNPIFPSQMLSIEEIDGPICFFFLNTASVFEEMDERGRVATTPTGNLKKIATYNKSHSVI